jgi:hypothetical protein
VVNLTSSEMTGEVSTVSRTVLKGLKFIGLPKSGYQKLLVTLARVRGGVKLSPAVRRDFKLTMQKGEHFIRWS